MEPTWAKLIMIMIISQQIGFIRAPDAGINYGLNGDNLLPPSNVIDFIHRKGISRVRLFEPNAAVLEALRGFTDIAVSVGTRNEDLASLANSQQAATDWLNTNIVPYYNNVAIVWITAGNEVIPGENAQYVLPAIQNLQAGLQTLGLRNVVVTTVVATSVLATSYPPSQGAFGDQNMIDVVGHLNGNGLPLMINLYPYFALVSDPTHISLEYALFTSTTPVVTDGNLQYYNLFDAMFDSFVTATEKAVGNTDLNMSFIVSESGWPSAGDQTYATIDNARTYNNNLKNHLQKGTPRYQTPFDVFFFALFNENQKSPGVEQNFGNYYPDGVPVYPLW